MGNFKNIVIAAMGIWAVGITAAETCDSLPARTGVGRDTGSAYDSKEDWCPSQIKTCGFICGGRTSVNTCNLFSNTYACYECKCADGTTPALEQYWNTIPSQSCQQIRWNCASSPSGSFTGACDALPKCGEIYLTAPLGTPTLSTPVIEPVPVTLASTTTTFLGPSVITTSLSTTVSSTTISSTTISSATPIISSTTSSLSPSTLALATSQLPANTTVTRTSTSSSRSSKSTSVTTTFLEGAAVMTAVPWVQAAIGVIGLAVAGI